MNEMDVCCFNYFFSFKFVKERVDLEESFVLLIFRCSVFFFMLFISVSWVGLICNIEFLGVIFCLILELRIEI